MVSEYLDFQYHGYMLIQLVLIVYGCDDIFHVCDWYVGFCGYRRYLLLHVARIIFLWFILWVELSVVWGFPYLETLMTLSLVWSSGKGSFSLVWSSGRGLVRVLYFLTCSKQWGEERWFALFRLVASIVLGVRCINVFTNNSLRNKGDSLAAIAGHLEPSISRKLDVIVG